MTFFSALLTLIEVLTAPPLPPKPEHKVSYPPAPDFSHLPDYLQPAFLLEYDDEADCYYLTAERAGFDDRVARLSADEAETMDALGGLAGANDPEGEAFLAAVWQKRAKGWAVREKSEIKQQIGKWPIDLDSEDGYEIDHDQ